MKNIFLLHPIYLGEAGRLYLILISGLIHFHIYICDVTPIWNSDSLSQLINFDGAMNDSHHLGISYDRYEFKGWIIRHNRTVEHFRFNHKSTVRNKIVSCEISISRRGCLKILHLLHKCMRLELIDIHM